MAIQKAKGAPVRREDVDARLLAIGKRELDMEALENEMNREIDAVKARYAKRLGSLAHTIKAGAQGLRMDVEDSRDALFPTKRKTINLLFGKVGFRGQPGSVKLGEGINTEQAVTLLERRALHHLVHIEKRVSKDAIRKRLADGEIGMPLLQSCGIMIVAGGEDFWYQVDRASVREEMKKG